MVVTNTQQQNFPVNYPASGWSIAQAHLNRLIEGIEHNVKPDMLAGYAECLKDDFVGLESDFVAIWNGGLGLSGGTTPTAGRSGTMTGTKAAPTAGTQARPLSGVGSGRGRPATRGGAKK